MKNFYLLFTVLLFFNFNGNAQIDPFFDGFEDCTSNGEGACNYYPWWWDGCGGGSGCCFICSDVYAHTGDYSGLVNGDGVQDVVLDLGNKIFDEWGLEFWMYIPSDKVAYWNLQGEVPIGAGEWIVGNVFFNQDNANPGVGLIDDTALGELNFNFPHDQWFRVVMNWDISNGITTATWQFNVDGIDVVPFGTPFTKFDGTPPTSLGGMDFFSISTDNELYVDDFNFVSGFIDPEPVSGPFTDDMESYSEGEPIFEEWWGTWGCGEELGCALESSSNQAKSGSLSGLVPGDGTTDAVLNLGNKINGTWGLEYWTYIPSNKEAFIEIKECVPVCSSDWYLYALFNQNLDTPGEGVIINSTLGDVSFSFPHDQWFKLIMNIDLTNGIDSGTWQYIIDGNEIIPSGTPFKNADNQSPVSFGGLGFFSISTNNELYVDDFNYIEGLLGTSDFTNLEFSVYPNPSNNYINIKAQDLVKNVTIFNVQGMRVKETTRVKTIDISNLSVGLYFVEVSTEKGRSVQKFIKK